MRGPALRIQCDVRRLWECPRCRYQRRAPATETVVRCHCIKEEPCMRLVEGVRRVRPEPQPLDHFLEFDPAELADLPTRVVTPPEPLNEPAEPGPETSSSEAPSQDHAVPPSDQLPVENVRAAPEVTASEPLESQSIVAAASTDNPTAEPPRKPKRKRNRRRGRKGGGAATEQSATGDSPEASGDEPDDDSGDIASATED